jgi:PAS domain S-box-containing protein
MAENSTGVMRDRELDRRRPLPDDQSPIEALRQMPALVVLERLPAPALAVDRSGVILFANSAFCDMLGYAADDLLAIKFDDILRSLPIHDDWATLSGTGMERVVELRHRHGHSVWSSMSKSVMRRREDTIALATFRDRTEELWLSSDGWPGGQAC